MRNLSFSKIKADHILHGFGFLRQKVPFLIRRPLGYYFYITSRCNLNCDYCWQREREDCNYKIGNNRNNELSGDEWIKVIQSIPKMSFVGLTGGEPLLHPDFKNITEYLSGRLPYTVNTNGVFLNIEMINHLVKYNVSNISVSLDGFADVHDIYRGKAGLFDQIVTAVKELNLLKEKRGLKKPSITIKTVLLDPMAERLIDFYRFCNDTLKADCLNISIMKTTQHAQYDFRVHESLKTIHDLSNPMCFQYENGKRVFDALKNLLLHSEKKHCGLQLYPNMQTARGIDHFHQYEGKGVFGPCFIPWSLITILADGTVIPCLSLKITNIREIDYNVRKITSLEKYQQFLKWRSGMNQCEISPIECNMCCFSRVKQPSIKGKT